GGYGTAFRNAYVSGTLYASSTFFQQNGTAGSPVLTWSSDDNTGIYLASDDMVGVSGGGNTVAYFVKDPDGVYPHGNNAMDLGLFSMTLGNLSFGAWRNFYVSGTSYIGGLTISPDGVFTIGTSTAHTITLNSRFASNILPSANNARDLGAYGNGWRDVFASGTVYAATTTVVNRTDTSTLYLKSEASSKGGRIVLEDSDGSGCSVISINDGTITAATVTCPTE
ncbi:MAG: hypothetical protein AAB932_06285, partial [Patescibacteria group bacterium]